MTLPSDWQAPCTAYVDQFGESMHLCWPSSSHVKSSHVYFLETYWCNVLLVHLNCCLFPPTGEQIFAYIETLDPTTICTNFGACMPSQLYSNMSVPPLPLALVAKAAALRMRAHELSATNDFCDTCKMVITEAAAILGNLVSSQSASSHWRP